MHQHLSLGDETKCRVLVVLLAEQIAQALLYLFDDMAAFLRSGAGTANSLDHLISQREDVREVELEFLCGIVNDCGMHLDEVLVVLRRFSHIILPTASSDDCTSTSTNSSIGNKSMSLVQDHVDAAFKNVGLSLTRTSNECLHRLAALVLRDVAEPFGEVFTQNAWLELYDKSNANNRDTGASTTGNNESTGDKSSGDTPSDNTAADGDATHTNRESLVGHSVKRGSGTQVDVIFCTVLDYLNQDFVDNLRPFWYVRYIDELQIRFYICTILLLRPCVATIAF